MDSTKTQHPTTAVLANNKDPPLECGRFTNNGGMWIFKHEISSPKFYELVIKTELKGDTDMDLKKSHNHIKICLNAVTRLQEDPLPYFHSIKRHSDFQEYSVSDRSHPYWPLTFGADK